MSIILLESENKVVSEIFAFFEKKNNIFHGKSVGVFFDLCIFDKLFVTVEVSALKWYMHVGSLFFKKPLKIAKKQRSDFLNQEFFNIPY